MSDTLRTISARAMKQACNDVAEARRLAWKWIEADPSLYASLIVPLVMTALDDECRDVLHAIRRTAWGSSAPSGEAKMSATLRLGHQQVAEDRLLAYPLRSGKALGEATKNDLDAEANYYLSSGKTHLIRGTWLQLIAGRLKAKTVKEQFTERQLASLQKTAEARVAT